MEMDKDELIGTVIITILGILFIGWLLFSPTTTEHCPEKQQVEHVRPQPHHKASKSYKYGYDPIHHKFRWHWE